MSNTERTHVATVAARDRAGFTGSQYAGSHVATDGTTVTAYGTAERSVVIVARPDGSTESLLNLPTDAIRHMLARGHVELAPAHNAHDSVEAIISCEHADCVELLTPPRYVGLTGKIGPAFTVWRTRRGHIVIADPDNDSTWTMDIPGAYFGDSQPDALRASFDHLLACEAAV